MGEQETNDGVRGVGVGGLESAGVPKKFGGGERWAEGDDVVFGDL